MTSAQLSVPGTAPRVGLGDGLAGLASLEPGSVDLVLSDLPSGETAAGFDVAPDPEALWPAVWHALKPNGIALFMASSIRFAASLITSQPKAFRYDLIWEKSIATGFLNSKHRPLRSHEFVLVFWRSGDVAWNVQMLETGVPIQRNGSRGDRGSENYGNEGRGKGMSRFGKTDRYPRSVLKFRSVHVRDPHRVHPQQKPCDLGTYLVRTYSNPGDLVVDPFAGSGAFLQSAMAVGRRAIGWDSSPRFGSA